MFTSREHVMSLESRGKGLLGINPYEVRDEKDDEKVPKEMLELAHHIVEGKSGHFTPKSVKTNARMR